MAAHLSCPAYLLRVNETAAFEPCDHPSSHAGHEHTNIRVEGEESVRLSAAWLGPRSRARGIRVSGYCPDCPGEHFHTESRNEAGELTVGGVETVRPAGAKERAKALPA